MAGILEDERDPLDFLADFPTPLTSTQRADLAWHRSKLDGNRAKMKKIVSVFLNRRQQTERFVAEAESKLEALLNGTPATSTAPAAVSAAVATTSASTCLPSPAACSSSSTSVVSPSSGDAVAPKRPREESEEESGDVRAKIEAQEKGKAIPPPSQPPLLPTPAAPAAPAAAPRRKFGGAFGGLKSLLADVKKDNTKDEALRKQREEMARKAEEDKIRGDISIGRGELADIDFRLETLKSKMEHISQQYDDLTIVLNEMDEQETNYAQAFFMSTKGCEAEAGYEISFRLAQTPETIRELISRQVEKELDTYLSFRDRTDPFLIEISENRARRSLKAQEDAAAAAASANAGAAGQAGVVAGGEGVIQESGASVVTESEGVLGTGGVMAADDDVMRMVMGVSGGILGGEDLEAMMDAVGGEADAGESEAYEGFPLQEEEDLDRYDY